MRLNSEADGEGDEENGLADLIRKRPGNSATAILAIPATQPANRSATVARIARIAPANPPDTANDAPETAFKRNSRKIAALQKYLGRKPTWQEVLAEIAYDKEVKNDDQGLV